MIYPSSHIAIPISQSAHIAPTISVIGRAFSIQASLAHVMARTCRRSATQYKPTGGSFIGRRHVRCR